MHVVILCVYSWVFTLLFVYSELLAKLPKVAQNKESIEEQANALNDFF